MVMETRLTLTKAADEPIEGLHAAFVDGYQGYYVRVDLPLESFRAKLIREHVDLAASATVRLNDEIVGLGLLSIRGARGWVSSVGVAPEYRGRGLGEALMCWLMDEARARGVQWMWLEVLTQNEPAIRLYRKLGFQSIRQLFILSRPTDAPRPARPGVRVIELPFERTWPFFDRFHGVRPCWQREWASLEGRKRELKARTITIGPEVIAELLFVRQHNQLRQFDLAGDPGFDRRALGKTLLQALHYEFPLVEGVAINVSEDDPMLLALYDVGYVQTISQYEMVVSLGGDSMG
jgi:ribosomal protein S18 acetylase RimI-like enzyme